VASASKRTRDEARRPRRNRGRADRALEAVAFAILAYQMLRGLPGNIPSVTGARSPAILGKLTLPPSPR